MQVQGTKVDSWDDLKKGPGYWMFSEAKDKPIGGILYNCPCGCGRIGGFPFRPFDGQGASWEWNGDQEKPSCTPSIRHITHSVGPLATEKEKLQAKCDWHGYLTNGVWVSC